MAWTDLGSLGATGSTANNQASLSLTTTAAVAVGDFVVVVIAVDNLGTADGDNAEVSSVTNSGTANTWTKALSFSNAQGAAQAGAACAIYYTKATNAISSGGTITANFSNAANSDASAMTARKFSVASNSTVSLGATNTLANDGADPGSLNATTPNREALRIRGIAAEVGNNTNLTATGSWTAWANGNSATTGTTAEMCARAESIISTGTGSASDPTYVAADCASCYVTFYENLILEPSLYTNSLTNFTPQLNINVTPDLFTNTLTVFNPTVEQPGGTQDLTADLFIDTDTVFNPSLVLNLTAALYTDADTVFNPQLNLNLTPSLFTDPDTVFNPSLIQNLTTALYTNDQTFFTHTIAAAPLTLTADLYVDPDTFFQATISRVGDTATSSNWIINKRRRR